MDHLAGRQLVWGKRDDLRGYFEDFLDSLTYPQIRDEHADDDRWLSAMRVIGSTWHTLNAHMGAFNQIK